MCRSFTYTYNGISKYIVTDIEIGINGKTEKMEALWDTGATITFINENIINKYNLQSIGDGFTDTLSEDKVPTKKYRINLILSNNIEFPNIEVACRDTRTCDIIIGMDIISQGDFAISNFNGKTKMVFRMPSMGEFGYEPIKSDRVGRNDPCPCGSGKKHKHCCIGKKPE